jgi:hypothetical protein
MKTAFLTPAAFAMTVALQATAFASDTGTLLGDRTIPGGQVLPGRPDAETRELTETDSKPVVQLSLNTDEQTALLAGTFDWSTDSASQFLTVKLQTPLDQDKNYTNVVNLDGLNKASSLSFAFTRQWGGLDYDDVERIAREHTNEKPKKTAIWAVTFDGKIGYERHTFYDPLTLAPSMTTKTPFQLGATMGVIFGTGNMSFNLSADYQQGYEDSPSETKCINSGADCVTGFFGAPAFTERALITGDFRWITQIGKVELGFGPILSYDAIQDEESVQVPLYLVTDKNGFLNGGIRYDWNSTDHVSTVGIFVSSAFSVGILP